MESQTSKKISKNPDTDYSETYLPKLQFLCINELKCDKIWQNRAQEKFGISLNIQYLPVSEKYLQIAAFQGEFGYGSENHVPISKCLLYAAEQNDLDLLEY